MKILVSTLSVLLMTVSLIAGLATQASAKSICAEQVGSCGYYTCMSQSLGCAPGDYTERLAIPYCTNFIEDMGQYTRKGQAFIVNVETCLQNQIEQKFSPATTCKTLQENAADEHTQCYDRAGFCRLPLADRFRIGELVMGALFSPADQFGRTLFDLLGRCADEI